MKTISIFAGPLVLMFTFIVFCFNIDLGPMEKPSTTPIDPDKVWVVETNKEVIDLHCNTISQRISVSNQTVEVLNLELEKIQQNSTESKISINNSTHHD